MVESSSGDVSTYGLVDASARTDNIDVSKVFFRDMEHAL